METRLKMNYLNSYKIFESSNQYIISDINDIFLLDIKDIDNEYNKIGEKNNNNNHNVFNDFIVSENKAEEIPRDGSRLAE